MWNFEEIKVTLDKGESETVELKKSTSLMREAVESVCAFANQHGGYLVFGVRDNGEVVGAQATDGALRNIVNEIKLNTDPKLYPCVEQVIYQEQTCILVTVEESPLKPHLAYGRPFLRVGPTNQRLDRSQYEQLLLQRQNGYGFDFVSVPTADLADIDTDALYHFLETANAVRNLNENLLLPPEMILEKLDLMQGGQLTRAALLLFGKKPEQYFPGCFEVRCGIFPADLGYDEILNNKELKANLLSQFEGVYGYVVEAQTSDSYKSHKAEPLRMETPEFPFSVIREAVVNMIVHRDYRQGVKSTVEVRPSVISFSNTGHLFEPTITIESLRRAHPSRPGNRLIAKVFYLMGLFENWGSGTLKIISECAQAGKREPLFSFEDGMFTLALNR